jgi:DNA polymerase-1
MTERARLFLIDGHALAYRTYFALSRVGDGSRFITRSGEPTAGVYGFASVLLHLLNEEQPEYLAVSFDTGRTFRDDIFPQYKATRAKMPEDMVPQLERIRELVQAFGIPIFEKEGYEADDVLGTMSRNAPRAGAHAIILTGDRDLLQLADEHTTIRLAGQRLSEAQDFGPQEVVAKLGVRPEQIVDYKALVGDPSDNIPGVRGIGQKTAIKLLQQYGTLDEIYAHLDEIPARFRNKLEAGKEDAYLSRELAKIVTDLPIEFDLEQCRARGYDRDRVVELFRELEFRSLLDRLPLAGAEEGGKQLSLFISTAPKESPTEAPYEIVSDQTALDRLLERLASAEQVAFDVETTSTSAMQARLVGISLARSLEDAYYIPLGHNPDLAGSPQLPLQQVLASLAKALQDPKLPKVGHNLKYDYIVLARLGLPPAPLAFDTMIAEWLCDPASRNLGLKNLAWVRLGIEMTTIEELIGRGRNQRSMADVAVQEVAPYAAADARICLQLKPQLENELKEKDQLSLFHDMEMPLVPVLAEMEMTGILMDMAFLQQFSQELAARLEEIEGRIYELVGHPFNINSTRQLSQVLFQELGLKPPDRTRKTASGQYSTAAGVLEQLRQAHPVVSLILEQREIAKLKSTYADALLEQVNPDTGRIHTSYNQTGSVTGRIASSDPNLQNIPIRTEIGRRIRRAFRAAQGHMLLGVDYSQIELRIVAHMAGDKAMIQAFREGQDIHAATAAAVFGIRPQEVTPAMRRRAKAVNFGLIYGMSPFGLTRTTDLTLAEAEQFVRTYFERFPGVKRYLETTRRKAAQKGYVETLFGRRRYFPQLLPGARVSEQARARAEREAVNAPIQGTAADIIKIAMIRLAESLRREKLGARMLLQVHDELVLECPQDELSRTAQLVRQVMENAAQLKVPLKADASAGPNWAQMEPIEAD